MAHEGLNLATLWLPISPSTAGLGKEMEEVGRQAFRSFQGGFNAEDFGSKAGKDFSSKFIGSFTSGLTENSVGHAIAGFTNRLTEQTDAALAASLKGKLPGIYREATRATEELRAAEQRAVETRKQAIASIDQNKQAQVRATEDVARATVAARAALVAYREAEKAGKLSTEELTAASLKSVTATNELAQAKVRLREATTAQHRADQEARDAVKEVGAAHEKATAATEQHRDALEEYTAATSSAHTMSGLLGGVMGGALVLGVNAVVEGFEKIAEVGVDMFKDGIEGAKELTEKLLEVGETFEGLEIQLREFSGATGEVLEAMNSHVKGIFGSLDVDGKNLGQTYAKLATVLHAEASPALDELARNVTELQGRFQNLSSQDIAEIFTAFHTPLEETNGDLAFLLQESQDAGIGLGDFAALMGGQVSESLASAGLNIRQAALFTSDLAKSGVPARQAMGGLTGAMKVFAAHNMSFADGMKEAKKELDNLSGDAAAQDARAEAIFGSKWAVVKPLIDAYFDAQRAGGDALDVPINKLQDFYNATQTLENKVDSFKNKLYEAFAPFGTQLTSEVGGALDNLSNWFTQHQSDIANGIESWGDKFIDLLPKIKNFAAAAVDMMGPLLDGLAEMGSLMMTAAAAAAAVTLHWDDVGPFMSAAADLGHLSGTLTPAGEAGGGGPLDKFTGGLKDQINSIDTNSQALNELKEGLHDATDAMRNAPGATLPNAPGAPAAGAPGGPGGPAAPGYSGPGGSYPPGPGVHVSGPAVPGPSSPNGPPGPGTPAFAMPGAPLPAPGGATPPLGIPGGAAPSGYRGHPVNWQGIAQAESSGNWQITYGEGDDVTGGLQIATATWLSHGGGKYAPKAYMASPEHQIEIAQAVLNDQGPKAWPTTYRDHPEYFSKGGSAPASGNGLSKLLAKFGFGPKGKDTVLSYYTPGEFVVTEDTMEKHGPLIRALQGKGRYFAGGGTGSADAYASNPGGDDTQGVDAEILGADAVAHGFGLRLTAGKSGHGTHDVDGGYHDSGMAGDFSNGVGTPQEAQFAMYMAQNFGGQIAELIHYGPGWDANYNIKDGKFIRDYGGVPKVYDMGTLNGHQDHVHVAMKPGSAPSLEAMGQGTTAMSGGSGWAGASATPAGWGGGGGSGGSGDPVGGGAGPSFADAPYGPGRPPPGGMDTPSKPGETFEQWVGRSQRLGGLQQRQVELQNQINDELTRGLQIQKDLDDDAKKDAFDTTKMKDEQRHAKEEELRKSRERVTTLQGEQAKAQGDEAIDTYEASQPSKQHGKESGADSAAHTLGGSFLSGLGQEFGLDGLIGKSPLDWGATRLFGSIMKYVTSGFSGSQGGGQTTGMFPNAANGAAGAAGFPPPFTLTPGQAPQAPTPPGMMPTGPAHMPVIPGMPQGPGPGNTPPPKPGAPGTPQTPAGAPGSIVPPAPGQRAAPTGQVLPSADITSSSDHNYGNRYAAGFDDGKGGRQAEVQGAPWASAVSSLTTMALGFAGSMVPGVNGKPAGIQVPGGGGQFSGGSGGGGQGAPLGATGIMQGYGSVPTSYQGDTHNYHVDNSTTWNVSPKNDASMVQHLQQHQNSQRDNGALASHMVPTP
jgi:resuscitation-promoting factor RpfE